MKPVLAFLFTFNLLIFSLEAQERDFARMELTDERIVEGVSRLLRWSWYWEARPLRNYVQGSTHEIAVVESPTEIATFLAEIGIGVNFDLAGNVIGFPSFPPTTNASAVERYIAEYEPTANSGPPVEQGTYIWPRNSPSLTMEEKRRLLVIRTIQYTLPSLEPPEAIVRRLRSSELPRLKESIPAALESWYDPVCGNGEIAIPFFAADEPWVPVYADLGTCGKGVIYFTHRDEEGPWKSGPFWSNESPNDFSRIILKIRDNVVDSVRLPLESN